jgi:hypothetical protein
MSPAGGKLSSAVGAGDPAASHAATRLGTITLLQ